MANIVQGDRWSRKFHTTSEEAPHLVCFPYAGGSAGWFARLSAHLAGDVRVSSIQYPGRLDRLHEQPIGDLHVLADEVVAALDTSRPVSLFGHSMGAVVAFEVARRLQAASVPVPHLFVSGRSAPHLLRNAGVHLMSDDDLITVIESLGGVPPGVLRDAELRAMVVPVVRNDYRAIETYRCAPAALITAPITALAGTDDPLVPVPAASEWTRHTTGTFAMHELPGGHFFPVGQWETVAALVRRRLCGEVF
ncbi:thioesterase II family protein [Lentzea sp. NEAU-D7]|uniref:thioesterase II family protein n=1 Tax=Lentzea sp. NEAU-D7 TaxID=2994667 RepID=UPI00224A858F|nr:alpha/beta fold hydrolase [Lentzea sp. NEAU-D7]MCX2954720.1 alpha/beta fold hydrolase [Lentzea sp. NEAU-D7]